MSLNPAVRIERPDRFSEDLLLRPLELFDEADPFIVRNR